MNYLNPAWLEGLYNPRYRGTGRTQRMIRLISLKICEIEKLKQPEIILLCAEPHYHMMTIYSEIMNILYNLIQLKEIKFTKIIKGNTRYFAETNLYGYRIKNQNIFIDHYVYEKLDNVCHDKDRWIFFEKLKYITIPD